MDSAYSAENLSGLELRLRSCSRGVGVLVLAEFDRRKWRGPHHLANADPEHHHYLQALAANGVRHR